MRLKIFIFYPLSKHVVKKNTQTCQNRTVKNIFELFCTYMNFLLKTNTSDKAYLTFSIFIYVVKDVNSLSKKICAFLFFSSCFFLGICFWYFHFFLKSTSMYFLFLYCASVLFRWLTPPLIIVLAKNFPP